MRMAVPSEAAEQRALFRWADVAKRRWPALALLYHVPNGGTRDAREAHNLRLQGVKSGVPDICFPVARGGYHALYIELKRRQGGKVSEQQRWWLSELEREGNLAIICRGADEAIEQILRYLRED